MRNLKKLVALIVTLAMMATFAIPAFAATPPDVVGTEYEGAAIRLGALGVFTGYPDGNFGPNDAITRAQAAAVLVRSLGYESIAESAKGVTKFSDVAANYWGAGYINLAVSLGLIKGYGDGKFGPEDNVTFDQMATMIVRALGQEAYAESKGGFPTGYLLQAKVIGFTDGVKGVSGANAPRGIVAQMVDNAKEEPIYIQEGFGDSQTYKPGPDTFLSKLGMTPVKDVIVTKTPAIGGDADKLTAGSATVASAAYTVVAGTFDIESVLGKKVTLWKNSDGKVVLAQVSAGTEVAVKSITSFTVVDDVYTKIKVKDTADVEKEYTILSSAGATYNLKADTVKNVFNAIDDIMASTDKFDLTLTVDGDNLLFAKGLVYDKPVKIGDPVVNTVNKSIKVGANYFIKKGDKDAKALVIIKDGETVDYTALKKDDVIMVAKNVVDGASDASGDYFYILATSKTLEGKLTAAKPSAGAATSVKIGDTFYSINQWDANEDVAAKLDKEVIATLDPNGKILSAIALKDGTGTPDKYGVILGKNISDAYGERTYGIRVLTSSGDKIDYTIVKNNDTKALTDILDGSTAVAGKLITYYVNSDGKIADVDIAGGAVASTTLDVDRYKYGTSKFVKSNVAVFNYDSVNDSYSVVKWEELKDESSAAALATVEASDGEYTALLLQGAQRKETPGNYAYIVDYTAIAGSKYVVDLVSKNGAESLTTSDSVYGAKNAAYVYTINSDGKIKIGSALSEKKHDKDIDEVSSVRIKVDGNYYYFKTGTVIVFDGDANGGSDVAPLTKDDLYTDMQVRVYSDNNLEIDVLVITKM